MTSVWDAYEGALADAGANPSIHGGEAGLSVRQREEREGHHRAAWAICSCFIRARLAAWTIGADGEPIDNGGAIPNADELDGAIRKAKAALRTARRRAYEREHPASADARRARQRAYQRRRYGAAKGEERADSGEPPPPPAAKPCGGYQTKLFD